MALALFVGVAGGAAFAWIGAPLPWLLGPLLSCMLSFLMGLPLESPTPLRSPIAAVIGIMLGASYTPDLLQHVAAWWITILGLFAFMTTAVAACFLYFRTVAGFDRQTAFFSAMPGGLSEMLLISHGSGADTRRVVLVQAGRIVFTVYTVPFLVGLLATGPIDRSTGRTSGLADMEPSAYLWLAACLVAGLALARLLRLPARYLIVPMAVSAAVHLAGWSSFRTPWEIVLVAQVILGTIVGCSFVGFKVRNVLRILLISLGSSFLLILLGLAFAWGVGPLAGYRTAELLLAYAPGGVAEMGVLALALQMEVAMVSLHHAIRILLIVLAAPLLAGAIARSETGAS